MTSIAPNDFLAESRPACELSRIRAVEREHLVGGAEVAVVGGNRVVGDRDAADCGRHRDGEERYDQGLLAPLAAEHAPRPADHSSPGGNAAISRPAAARTRERVWSSPIAGGEQ